MRAKPELPNTYLHKKCPICEVKVRVTIFTIYGFVKTRSIVCSWSGNVGEKCYNAVIFVPSNVVVVYKGSRNIYILVVVYNYMTYSNEKQKQYCKDRYHNDPEHREKVKQNAIEWNKKNRGRVNETVKQRREKARDILLSYLGMRCKICGYNDPRALVFDHINNDGHIHRKKHGNTSNEYIRYSKNLQEAEKIIQVLCANCNTIKAYNYRYITE